jgi:hypothetical protein
MPAPAAPATSRIATTGTRDYDTWTSWEVDMAGDITGLGVYRGQGAAEVFSENFAFAGTTTTASDYVVMEPEAGAKHTGRVTTGCRITSASSGGTVRINTQHLRIDGLCILNTSNNAAVSYAIGAFVAGANDHRMTACILKAGATSATTTVLNASRSNLVFTLENTVIYGPLRTLDTRIAATVKINHVTGWRTADQIGFLCRAEATITNSYSGKASGVLQDFWLGNPFSDPDGSNNVSSDTTATVDFTGSAVSKAGSGLFTNVTVGSEDFSLKAGAFLIDFGTGALATDIIGATRDGSPDVGAFEFVGCPSYFQDRMGARRRLHACKHRHGILADAGRGGRECGSRGQSCISGRQV